MLKSFLFLLFASCFFLYGDDFSAVLPILKQYDRPITVLSIGENELFYQIAQNYPATCILATPENTKVSENQKIIHLRKKLSFKDLVDLNRREHFDIILAFHTLHELTPWKKALHELFKLSDHLIIKILPITSQDAKINPSVFGLAHYLTHLGLTQSLDSNENIHFFWYCFKPKVVYPHLYVEEYPKGITLTTHQKHHGTCPSEQWIKQEKKKLPFWKKLAKTSIRVDEKTMY